MCPNFTVGTSKRLSGALVNTLTECWQQDEEDDMLRKQMCTVHRQPDCGRHNKHKLH